MAVEHDWVRPVWLSRNYGQHASTLAGMACSASDWVATLDEDGQHDPAELGAFLDRAMEHRADVVYGSAVNAPPHGVLRNFASRAAKGSIRRLTGNEGAASFNSYRFILGDVARSVAAFSGSGVYLDVALGWVAGRVATCPVHLRAEHDRPSGYTMRSLMSHYWRMVITGGTRLLRGVSLAGVALALLGFVFAVYVVGFQFFSEVPVQGWASVMVVMLLGTGAILFALGVVAEYLGVAVNMAMGKPLYLIVGDRESGPHGRTPAPRDGA